MKAFEDVALFLSTKDSIVNSLVSLLLAWGFITLVGHFSWVLISHFYQSLLGFPSKQRVPNDRDGFNKILDRLVSQGLISREQAAELWEKAEESIVSQVAGFAPVPLQAHSKSEVVSESVVLATLISDAPISYEEPYLSYEEPTRQRFPLSDRRAWSDVIASFLAVHNIRWGELIAGVLIVFCSIGLVLSLWSTLTTVHRVVPALIFMTANAAIFLAGFYTLAKWKLRHTSRAVILIATLLVPLSVMAGLATTQDLRAAVSLNDPITVSAILFGIAVNGVLLLGAGRALYGRKRARAFAVSVAGPTLVIPFIPALLRTFGESAGYIVLIASAIAIVAQVDFQKPRRSSAVDRRLLSAGARRQWTFLGVSAFALIAPVLAFAYIGRDLSSLLWSSLLIGTLPSIVAWAMGAHWTRVMAVSAVHRYVAQVISVLCCILIFAALPVLAREAESLWMWAGVSTFAVAVVGNAYRRFAWMPLAVLPIGVAAILSSTSWMQVVAWDSVPWTRRIFGGEPMLSGLVLAAITFGLAYLRREKQDSQSLLALAALWFGLTSVNASILAFAGDEPFGVVSPAVHFVVLATLVLGSVYAALVNTIKPIVTVVLASILACSLFHPIALAPTLDIGDEIRWLTSLVFSGVLLMGFSEIAKRFAKVNRALMVKHWTDASVLFLGVSIVVIAFVIASDLISSHVFSVSMVLLAWLLVSARWLTERDSSSLSVSLGLCMAPCAIVTFATIYWDLHWIVWMLVSAAGSFVFSEAAARLILCGGCDSKGDATVAVSLLAIVCGVFSSSVGVVISAPGMVGFLLGSLVIVGLTIGIVWGRDRESTLHRSVMGMACGWVLLGGGWALLHQYESNSSFDELQTLAVVWGAGWVLYWQLALLGRARLQFDLHSGGAFGFSVLVAAFVAFELSSQVMRLDSVEPSVAKYILLSVRVIALILAAGLTWVCSRGAGSLGLAITSGIALISCVILVLTDFAGFSVWQSVAVAVISASVLSSLAAMGVTGIHRAHRFATSDFGSNNVATANHDVSILCSLSVSVGVATIATVLSMMVGTSYGISQLLISAIAITAFGYSELAERLNLASLRRLTLTTVLLAIYSAASVPVTNQVHPVLCGLMRWFIASVGLLPVLTLGMPRLLGDAWASRWRGAMNQTAWVCSVLAGVSLLMMLVQELMLRDNEGIAGLPLTLIVGVAITITMLSIVATWVSIASGPKFLSEKSRRFSVKGLELKDPHRRGLIVVAQVLGLVSWLHLFLCRREFALFGLQEYWPYIVLFIAFLSVGLVEKLKHWGDTVLAGTLRQTSLYLPLIPAVGMVMGSSGDAMTGAVPGLPSLTILLLIATGYYLWLSRLWDGFPPKVLIVLFMNSALWSLLAQRPDWQFFSHPQFWLIPPSICALVIAQRNRHSLDTKVLASIRYGATILIYVSSTADMLVQQIGTSLWGPVVLILLALAGVSAGVLMRVRPYLYLGSFFVLIGVMSMVWHAQRSIDQVWPWWVFGITMGVGLLAALMSIEKNKGKLQQLSARLGTWES